MSDEPQNLIPEENPSKPPEEPDTITENTAFF